MRVPRNSLAKTFITKLTVTVSVMLQIELISVSEFSLSFSLQSFSQDAWPVGFTSLLRGTAWGALLSPTVGPRSIGIVNSKHQMKK